MVEHQSPTLLVPLPLFLGPGFRFWARWNRLGEAVKTRKKRGKNGAKMGEMWSKRCEGVGITWQGLLPFRSDIPPGTVAGMACWRLPRGR